MVLCHLKYTMIISKVCFYKVKILLKNSLFKIVSFSGFANLIKICPSPHIQSGPILRKFKSLLFTHICANRFNGQFGIMLQTHTRAPDFGSFTYATARLTLVYAHIALMRVV